MTWILNVKTAYIVKFNEQLTNCAQSRKCNPSLDIWAKATLCLSAHCHLYSYINETKNTWVVIKILEFYIQLRSKQCTKNRISIFTIHTHTHMNTCHHSDIKKSLTDTRWSARKGERLGTKRNTTLAQ